MQVSCSAFFVVRGAFASVAYFVFALLVADDFPQCHLKCVGFVLGLRVSLLRCQINTRVGG